MIKLFSNLFLAFCFYILYNYLSLNMMNFTSDFSINLLVEIKKFVCALSIIFLSLFIIQLINMTLIEYFLVKKAKIVLPKFLIQILNVFIFLVFAILILNKVYGVSLTVLVATSSVLGVGIAYGMRDIISDVFAGIALQLEKPFKIGDSIELDDETRGVVSDITWRSTFIRTVYDTLISVPNSKVNSMNITNLNRPEKLYKLVEEFYLSYSVPIEKVRRIVLSVLESENFNTKVNQVNVHVVKLDTKGVRYLITYFCTDIIAELATRTKVLSKIISKLEEANLKPNYEILDINYTSKKEILEQDEKIDFLNKIDLFSNIDLNSLSEIVDDIKELKIQKGTTIIKEGDTKCSSLYLLKEGLLEVFKKDIQSGSEVQISFLESGNYFGEFSLLTGKPRSATIKAKTEVLLYEINFEHMKKLIQNNKRLEEHLSNILTEREILNKEKLNSFCNIDFDEKEHIKNKIINKMRKIFSH